MKKLIILISIILINYSYGTNNPPKIAIIGGTFGGALCAYYLRQLNPEIEIDIYDQYPDTEKYTILKFHPKQQYINQIILEKSFQTENLHPNENFLFEDENGEYWPWDNDEIKSIDPEAFRKLIKSISMTFRNFQKIYELQNDKKQSFKKVEDLLKALHTSFVNYMIRTSLNFINSRISQNYKFQKYLEPIFVANYMQGWGTSAFAALTAFWFTETNGQLKLFPLKRFKDTSYTVNRVLLRNPKNQILERQVESVVRKRNGLIHISSTNWDKNVSGGEESRSETKIYNIVIIAESEIDNIIFSGFSGKKLEICQYFDHVLTIFNGSFKKFNIRQGRSADKSISSIIRLLPKDYEMSNILDEKNHLWGYSACCEAEECDVGKLFLEPKYFQQIQMPGYPDYTEHQCPLAASFVLGKNLYHVNAIEWAAANIEMTAIGAKNVALLIYKEINP